MAKRSADYDQIGGSGKRRRVGQETALKCLEKTETELQEKLEEAMADIEYYKFTCQEREAELEDKLEEAIGEIEYYKFTCQEREAGLNDQLEEALAETEYYKFRCERKEEALDECRKRELELLDKLRRAEARAEMYKKKFELMDTSLQHLLETDELRMHGKAAAAADHDHSEAGSNVCGAEEVGMTVHPCNHISRCLSCETATNRCPGCLSENPRCIWADISN